MKGLVLGALQDAFRFIHHRDCQLVGTAIDIAELERTLFTGCAAMLLEGFSWTSSTTCPLGRSVKTRLPSASI